MGRRPANDLRENPRIQLEQDTRPELPVKAIVGHLTVEDGAELELMTHTTPAVVRAARIGYIYARVFRSSYVAGSVEQIERLAVSVGGQGRRDLIDAVEAGGKVPDAYYGEQGRKSSEASAVWEQ